MKSAIGYLIEFLFFVLFVLSLTALVVIPVELLSSRQCSNYGVMTGSETKYIYIDACYVKTNNGWVRYDSTTRKNFDGEL